MRVTRSPCRSWRYWSSGSPSPLPASACSLASTRPLLSSCSSLCSRRPAIFLVLELSQPCYETSFAAERCSERRICSAAIHWYLLQYGRHRTAPIPNQEQG